MRLCIVIPVLDSHEIVRRQRIHWEKIIPSNVGICLIDDGSTPPIESAQYYTNDSSPWSEHMATNIAIDEIDSEYILKTDIDHILTGEIIKEALEFEGDCLRYKNRAEATLDDRGQIVNTDVKRRPHSNTFVMRKAIYKTLGGYNEYGRGYDAGGSIDLWYRYMSYVNAGMIRNIEWSDNFIYVWPNSPITPMKDQHLFHGLRKTL